MNNDLEPPSLMDLAVFAAVAETGGFSSAARRLGVSKAMASTAVSRLERRLGVRLLQRTTRKLSLTAAGTAALPHAQRSLAAARDAEEAATEELTSPRGTLRLSVPMSFGILHVAPAVAAFARAYPEVQVDVVLDDRFVDLVEHGFDLAIRIGNLPDSALVAHRLGRNRNVLVAHAEYLKKAGTPKTPRNLAAHDTLIYSLSVASTEWTLHKGRRTERVKVKPRLQANSSLALRQAALGGLGIARIPLFAVGEDLRSRRLRRVLSDWELPEHGIFALTTSRLQQPRKTRAFIDFLHDRIGDPPYWEAGAD